MNFNDRAAAAAAAAAWRQLRVAVSYYDLQKSFTVYCIYEQRHGTTDHLQLAYTPVASLH